MSYDHYQETEELISMLAHTSLRHYGESLRRAMDDGATGTEIFMALRYHVGQLLEESLIDDVVNDKAKKLFSELDGALK